MTSRRLEQQYLRLLDIFPAQTGSTTLQELADKLHYSKRHMRSLLVQMQTLGWVDWLSVAGRGHRSQLNLLRNSHQMLVEKADKLIDEGSFDEALSLLGEEKHCTGDSICAQVCCFTTDGS